MFAEAGHTMAIYDPFYADNTAVLADCYDFITASEVVEHLRQPGEELERLFGLLKPGGILGIMTKLVLDRAAFSHWHYKRDPTHICFFSRATFAWLARRWQADMDMVAKDVVFFQKQACA
jgi:SAM-dependent methyltransferase